MSENKIEVRSKALVVLAAEIAKLMDENDELGKLIYAGEEAGTEEALKAIVDKAFEFKCHAAQIIGSLAMISTQIDNTSATYFLMEVAKQFIDFNLEHDPMDVLRGIIEN